MKPRRGREGVAGLRAAAFRMRDDSIWRSPRRGRPSRNHEDSGCAGGANGRSGRWLLTGCQVARGIRAPAAYYGQALKNRELILFGSLIAILVAGSSLIFVGDEPASTQAGTPSNPAETSSQPVTQPESARAPAIVPDPAIPTARSAGTRLDAGTIAGSISMTAEVALNVPSFMIVVRESVNTQGRPAGSPQPFQLNRTFPVLQANGTPNFEFQDVPFSEYGYTVSVHVSDYNGDEQYVRLTKEDPVARVHLGIRGGVEYSILVRDQERNPLPGLEVHMVPMGHPIGRKSFHGVSDSYGATVFEKVLKGDYRLSVGPPTAPLVDPKVVSLAPSGLQAEHVEVPRGVTLSFFVTSGGYGLTNVAVEATAVDTPQFKRYPLVTDQLGNAVFKHLPPGTYHVNFSAHGYVRRTEKVTVKADEQQPQRTIELTPER